MKKKSYQHPAFGGAITMIKRYVHAGTQSGVLKVTVRRDYTGTIDVRLESGGEVHIGTGQWQRFVRDVNVLIEEEQNGSTPK